MVSDTRVLCREADEVFAYDGTASSAFACERRRYIPAPIQNTLNLLANSFGLDFSRRKMRPKIELAEKTGKSQGKVVNGNFRFHLNYTNK